MDGITLKGEFQVDPLSGVRWFFGFGGRLTRGDRWLVAYAGLLASLLAFLVSVLLSGWRHGNGVEAWPVVALAGSAFLAERQSVRLSPRAEVSVSFLPIVLAAVIYGPLAAICVSVASLLACFKQPYGRWLIWTSTRSLAAGVAGLVALRIDGSDTHAFGRVLAAVVAATVVEQVGDLMLGSVVARLRGMPLGEIAKLGGSVFLAMPLYAPALLVYAYREVSPWSVALFLFPALAAQKLFLLYREQRATAEELALAIARQERASLSFATALVATLDARDQYTAGHSAAVAVYARDIARRLGLTDDQQALAHLCGLVHDIGKIGLQPGLLEKPGPLSSDERSQMESHPVIGERILRKVDDYSEIAEIVRHHHERVDGLGYPDGLLGDGIPLISRIIAVADAYNAMTSKRPYRDAMPSSVARIRMARGVGTQFDTAVVAAFEALLAGATEDYRCGRGSGFTFEGQTSEPIILESYPRVLEAVAS
jgi:putative nucleotidyltransferase with HDIG domain